MNSAGKKPRNKKKKEVDAIETDITVEGTEEGAEIKVIKKRRRANAENMKPQFGMLFAQFTWMRSCVLSRRCFKPLWQPIIFVKVQYLMAQDANVGCVLEGKSCANPIYTQSMMSQLPSWEIAGSATVHICICLTLVTYTMGADSFLSLHSSARQLLCLPVDMRLMLLARLSLHVHCWVAVLPSNSCYVFCRNADKGYPRQGAAMGANTKTSAKPGLRLPLHGLA